MSKQQPNQKGFALVESLLILIIFLLIGFVGYYVWHSRNSDNKSLDTSSKTTDSVGRDKTNKKPAVKAEPAVNIGYLTIKEWGIRARYNGKLDLLYKTKPEIGSNSVFFSSRQLEAAATEPESICSSGDYGGVITRYKSTDVIRYNGGSSTGQTAEKYFPSTLSQAYYAHIGDYYYTYSPPQAACSEEKSVQALQTQTMSAVQALIPTLEAESQ